MIVYFTLVKCIWGLPNDKCAITSLIIIIKIKMYTTFVGAKT